MAHDPTSRRDPDEETLARLAAPLREACVRPPEPETERRHVAAMAAVARQAPASAAERSAGPLGRIRERLVPAGHAGQSGRRRLVPAAASTLAACLVYSGATAGLAVAGVSLPDPVKAPFKVVGLTLPNQADDAAREALMRPKPLGSEADREDRESSGSRGADQDAERRSVDPPGSRETGRERSRPGRDTAQERSQSERIRPTPTPTPTAPRGAPQGAPQSAPQGAPRGGGRTEAIEPPAPARPRNPREEGVAPPKGAPQTAPDKPGFGPGNRSQGGTE